VGGVRSRAPSPPGRSGAVGVHGSVLRGAKLMRTRIAILSVLVGLMLLTTALVRYVTARDMQRQEPTAPLRGIPVIVRLLAAGAVSGAGARAAMPRWPRPALMPVAGVLLVG